MENYNAKNYKITITDLMVSVLVLILDQIKGPNALKFYLCSFIFLGSFGPIALNKTEKDFALLDSHQLEEMTGLLAEKQMFNIDVLKAEFLGPKEHPDLNVEYENQSYSYLRVPKTFYYSLDLSRSGELSRKNFEELILSAVPIDLQAKLQKYLPLTLALAEKYQVDPFWAVAIMWTESHFNPGALSKVKARGLMQIMPDTSHFLAQKIHSLSCRKTAVEMSQIPLLNIEMGVFYLKKLAVMFQYNYRLATVAYNMGPNMVRHKMNESNQVGQNNNYYKKVAKAYNTLVLSYVKKLKEESPLYQKTFVFIGKKKQGHNFDDFMALSFAHFDKFTAQHQAFNSRI